MFPEIEKLTRAYAAKHAPDLDADDLVQEVALTIAKRNASERSAFDPTRASFGKYVFLVAGNKAGHLREKRYHHGEVPTEDDALEAARANDVGEVVATKRSSADRRTVGELVSLIREAGQEACSHARDVRARDALAAARADGIAEAAKKFSALLDGGFTADVELAGPRPPVHRSRAPRGPDPRAAVCRTLRRALQRWTAAAAAEDARRAEELFRSPRGPKLRQLDRILRTAAGRRMTQQELAGRLSVSDRYLRMLLAELGAVRRSGSDPELQPRR